MPDLSTSRDGSFVCNSRSLPFARPTTRAFGFRERKKHVGRARPSKRHRSQCDNEPAHHANAANPKAPPATPHAQDDRGIPTRTRRPRHPRTAWNGESSRDANASAPAQDKSRPRLHALHQRPTQPRWQKLTDVSCRHRPIRNECGIYGTNAVFLTESSLRTHLRTANIGAYLPFSSIGALNKGLAPPLEHPPHRAAYARNA